MLIIEDKKKLHTGEFSGIIRNTNFTFTLGVKNMAHPWGSNASSRMERHLARTGEQGYKDRKDESIAMRDKKKRTTKQLKASADESYGKWGSGKKKPRGGGKINV